MTSCFPGTYVILDNGKSPPACNFPEGVDGKLKSNLKWPKYSACGSDHPLWLEAFSPHKIPTKSSGYAVGLPTLLRLSNRYPLNAEVAVCMVSQEHVHVLIALCSLLSLKFGRIT